MRTVAPQETVRRTTALNRHADPWWPSALGTLLLLALALPAPGSALEAQEVAIPLGSPAPDASLESLDGKPVELSTWIGGGKPTVLEFWAAWCSLCKALEPQLAEIHERWSHRVNVLAVAVPVSQTRRRVERHARENEAGYPYLWDKDGEAVRSFRVPGTSVVIILDGFGTVVYTGSGASQDLIGVVEGVLEKQSSGTSPDPDGLTKRPPTPANGGRR